MSKWQLPSLLQKHSTKSIMVKVLIEMLEVWDNRTFNNINSKWFFFNFEHVYHYIIHHLLHVYQ